MADADNASNVTFEFSEDVLDFDVTDLTVSGGVISGFTVVDGANYSATFTATDGIEATGSVAVDAGSYTDVPGNLGETGSDDVTIDTKNPSVETIQVDNTVVNEADVATSQLTVTVLYDEDMDTTVTPNIEFSEDGDDEDETLVRINLDAIDGWDADKRK